MSASRNLNVYEVYMAQRVFADSLPESFLRDKVMIVDHTGAGGRPFTTPDITAPGRYSIFLGFDWDTTSLKYKKTFIHEMVHVWQGYHAAFGWSYVFSSLIRQVQCNSATEFVYSFLPGKDWDDYTVEQQASIVDRWFVTGLQESNSDPLFRYIHNDIRKGRPALNLTRPI